MLKSCRVLWSFMVCWLLIAREDYKAQVYVGRSGGCSDRDGRDRGRTINAVGACA